MTSPQQRRAIHLVVILLVASISTSVLVTVLAVAVHAATLGPNQILILLMAILYVWVIRQLLLGQLAKGRHALGREKSIVDDTESQSLCNPLRVCVISLPCGLPETQPHDLPVALRLSNSCVWRERLITRCRSSAHARNHQINRSARRCWKISS